MPESEQQEKMLSETVVKEAVGLGMKSPLRDSIVEAVEEAEGTSGGGRSLPLAGLLFGAGAALGFLAGRQSPELEETSLEDFEEPDIIEDVVEERTGGGSESATETVSESESTDEGGSSRLPKLLLAVGLLAGVAVLRRRFASSEEDEWEPIEEFEPATSEEPDEEAESEEGEEMEAEAEADEGEETEE